MPLPIGSGVRERNQPQPRRGCKKRRKHGKKKNERGRENARAEWRECRVRPSLVGARWAIGAADWAVGSLPLLMRVDSLRSRSCVQSALSRVLRGFCHGVRWRCCAGPTATGPDIGPAALLNPLSGAHCHAAPESRSKGRSVGVAPWGNTNVSVMGSTGRAAGRG